MPPVKDDPFEEVFRDFGTKDNSTKGMTDLLEDKQTTKEPVKEPAKEPAKEPSKEPEEPEETELEVSEEEEDEDDEILKSIGFTKKIKHPEKSAEVVGKLRTNLSEQGRARKAAEAELATLREAKAESDKKLAELEEELLLLDETPISVSEDPKVVGMKNDIEKAISNLHLVVDIPDDSTFETEYPQILSNMIKLDALPTSDDRRKPLIAGIRADLKRTLKTDETSVLSAASSALAEALSIYKKIDAYAESLEKTRKHRALEGRVKRHSNSTAELDSLVDSVQAVEDTLLEESPDSFETLIVKRMRSDTTAKSEVQKAKALVASVIAGPKPITPEEARSYEDRPAELAKIKKARAAKHQEAQKTLIREFILRSAIPHEELAEMIKYYPEWKAQQKAKQDETAGTKGIGHKTRKAEAEKQPTPTSVEELISLHLK